MKQAQTFAFDTPRRDAEKLPLVSKQTHSLPAPALPSIFTLEITTVCNNFCSGCANVELSRLKRDRKNNIAYMRDWRGVIRAIIRNFEDKLPIIRLSGGEPTLHPEFEEIVTFLEENQLPHALLTTGRWTKLRPDQVLEIYKKCRHAAGMLVSLHGSNARSHQAFVESSEKAFEETCENIRMAAAQGLTVFTNTILTKQACEEIEEIVALSQSLGAACAVFNRFIGEGHPLQPTEQSLLQALETIGRLRKNGTNCRIGNSFPKCFSLISAFQTVSGYELCHISPDGRVRPDNLTPWSFGNLLQEPLKKIWQSPIAWEYRSHFPVACLDCAALPACRGGAKSPVFRTPFKGDPLIKSSLSFEAVQFLEDDKEKRQLIVLALTSD